MLSTLGCFFGKKHILRYFRAKASFFTKKNEKKMVKTGKFLENWKNQKNWKKTRKTWKRLKNLKNLENNLENLK
jgi:hypothetical protein